MIAGPRQPSSDTSTISKLREFGDAQPKDSAHAAESWPSSPTIHHILFITRGDASKRLGTAPLRLLTSAMYARLRSRESGAIAGAYRAIGLGRSSSE